MEPDQKTEITESRNTNGLKCHLYLRCKENNVNTVRSGHVYVGL